MNVLVTGGAGFIGSHVAEHYAGKGDHVVVVDNLSRDRLLKGEPSKYREYNWNYLRDKYSNSIVFIHGDVRDKGLMESLAEDRDVIIHTAAQTAVTASLTDPRTDFEVNLLGTFNVLEAARKSGRNPAVIFCSTNKVYGDNVNAIKVRTLPKRYVFNSACIPEQFPIDHCEHTPYGCSKLAADLYVQDYARRNEIKAGVFRMSCIYGDRQFGVEDQGWVSWFAVATLQGNPITIYGDGKQVRDILYVSDLVRAFDQFVKKSENLKYGVFNMGGGPGNTISLLELIDMLEAYTGKRSEVTFAGWRDSDQKVYVSDIRKAQKTLGWSPEITPLVGVKRLVEWLQEHEICLQ